MSLYDGTRNKVYILHKAIDVYGVIINLVKNYVEKRKLGINHLSD